MEEPKYVNELEKELRDADPSQQNVEEPDQAQVEHFISCANKNKIYIFSPPNQMYI